jgi:Protein of unknown function (DUF2909)
MRVIVIGMLGMVLVALFSGLYFMYKDKGETNRTVIALTIRVSLSICIILFFVVSYFMGWFPKGR